MEASSMTASSRRTIRLFVSSPGDVTGEREQVEVVVQELNTTLQALVPENPVVVELIRFETHIHPDMGNGPQDVINSQLDEYDIFLGIMWSRFGTPTPTAGSGTEEEFRAAYRGWEERRVPAHILFYFCEAPIPAPIAWKNAGQLQMIDEFRSELLRKGLVGFYQSQATFADTVRPVLIRVMSRILHAGQQPARIAERAVAEMPAADRASISGRIATVSKEYEATRAAMLPGDRRTRRLEVIATRMRSLAQPAYGFLPELTRSNSPGRRLMAVSILQVIPDPDYLSWLAERISGEKPFVAYHAAVALLAAAQTLPDDSLGKVRDAVSQATSAAQHLPSDSDRAVTLHYAQEQLRGRQPTSGSR
jgi:hypothetical protein